MTKADIIESVHAQLRYPKKQATEVVELLIETVKASLERGERVKISGFGHFHVRTKKSRVGRNPQTGEKIAIKGRRVLSFRLSKGLRESMNAPVPKAHAAGLNGTHRPNGRAG